LQAANEGFPTPVSGSSVSSVMNIDDSFLKKLNGAKTL